MKLPVRVFAAAVACVLAGAAPAVAVPQPPRLGWQPCGTAAGGACTTVQVPRDYRQPRAGTFQLMVAKSPATDPAHRIGTLFVNFGGPGALSADTFEAL